MKFFDNNKKTKKNMIKVLSVFLIMYVMIGSPLVTYATEIDYNAEAEARKSLEIQSNANENWPAGPAIGAEAAILIEANTGTILYSKNIHEELYPASTTKILTCLIAAEKAKLDETVTFSHNAVFSIEPDSSNMGMDEGEQITVEQTLYGILVGSANEGANAIAEHISGTVDEFAKLMNEKATEIGCQNSHFINPNGLYSPEHYTSAYDLALIGKEFFKNEMLCKMSSTATYCIPPTATQPDDIVVHSKNKLLPDREFTYDYLVGSKTGFTSEARQTLVSCAKKDGMTLICVILKEESPNQFADTVELFNYGFSNFQKWNVVENEKNYVIDNTSFFDANSDIFGNSKPVLSLNQDDYIVLPNTAVFTDTLSALTYDKANANTVATINYTYNGVSVGNVSVDVAENTEKEYGFSETTNTVSSGNSTSLSVNELNNSGEKVIFINVVKILLLIVGIAGLIIFIFVSYSIINNYQFSKRRNARLRRKKRRKEHKKTDKFDF